MRLFSDDQPWVQILDGDPVAKKIFDRHYSRIFYKDGRDPKLFVGPGEKLVLITKEQDALFVWRKFQSDDGQLGINCAIFRNESKQLSSFLLNEAEKIAWKRWPGERLYTYVNPRKIQSKNPGFCFKSNGWKKCGVTKVNKLIILEKFHDTRRTQ